MDWIEATLRCESAEIETRCAQLAALGITGLSIEDEADFRRFLEENRQYWDYVDAALEARFRGVSQIRFYLEDSPAGRAQIPALEAALGAELVTRRIADEDWENSWRDAYAPLPIGARLLVVPSWLEPELDGRIPLILEPGLAFGTGSHATTRMCLEAMQALELSGARALDLGCGSGILAIGALRLGCAGVCGCDIDPKAPRSALDNAALNGFFPPQIEVYAGDLLADEGLRRALGTGYALVMANIVADVIVPLSGFVRRFLAEDGVFLCSGIIDARAAEVERALRANGFAVERHLHEEEWHAFVCR